MNSRFKKSFSGVCSMRAPGSANDFREKTMEDGHINFVFLDPLYHLTSGSDTVSTRFWPLQGTDFDTFDFVSS